MGNRMKKLAGICLRGGGGLLLGGLLLFSGGCDGEPRGDGGSSDSSLINSAYAQNAAEQNAEITTSRQNAITRAVAAVSPAVVGINVTQLRRYRARNPWSQLFPELYRNRWYEQEVQSLGSGFIISADGYIVTNEHVVEDATEILVTMTDARRLKAKLVGSDRDSDIALLKIEGENFPYIPFGHSDDLLVGEWVIALGNPFGLVELNNQPTVTVGVISAIDRDWGRTGENRLYLDMIQTDAAINHGNSGGPLVNSLGQVIGMNTFIFTGSQYNEGFVGIGFAIPIDRIGDVVTAIREKGGINREYWHGIIDVQSLTRGIADALRLQVSQGVIVTELDSKGPAYRAGLRIYDVILSLEGKPVSSRRSFVNTLNDLDLKVGSVLHFKVMRDGKEIDINVTLENRPDRR